MTAKCDEESWMLLSRIGEVVSVADADRRTAVARAVEGACNGM